MIAGHLQEKKGLYYMVLSYKDKSGKRISKWLPTGLPVKGNKKRAEDMLMAARAEFVAGEAAIDRDMPFSSYLVQWMEIARSTLKPNTAAGYASMIQNPIAPYFQQRGITLGGLQAVDIQMFYTSQLKRVSANTVIHYHAIITGRSSTLLRQTSLMSIRRTRWSGPGRTGLPPRFMTATR